MDSHIEDLYASMVSRANGGTRVISQGAPSLATEFVRSPFTHKAQAGKDGALCEIVFPSLDDIEAKNRKKHGDRKMFGYRETKAADAYPAGYGERSARALQREEQTYQLKGTFPTAALALAKLRARVEARDGDVGCINRIFGRMWDLREEEVDQIPHLNMDGSEATRTSAMEDRAYHALAGHPAYSGGFRVDMATLSSDVLGDATPLNWARVRTGLKSIAVSQIQADIELSDAMAKLPRNQEFKFTMDLTKGSQPRYERPQEWERVLDSLMELDDGDDMRYRPISSTGDAGMHLMSTMQEAYLNNIACDRSLRFKSRVSRIAKMVSEESNRALKKTVEIIYQHDQDRALLTAGTEDEFEEHSDSKMAHVYEIPRYKLTRSSLHSGLCLEDLGRSNLPDVMSHGRPRTRFNHAEFRASNLSVPMLPQGVLNVSVYIMSNLKGMAMPCFHLLDLVKDPGPTSLGTVSSRLRSQRLYESADVRHLGAKLFGEEFIGIFESVLANVSVREVESELGLRDQLWNYLSNRSTKKRKCPVAGGWRDLVSFLRTEPEGWTLYYWARVSIGKRQYASSNDILAPIAAGEEVDFLTLIRRSIKVRANHWSIYYAASAARLTNEMTEKRQLQRHLEDVKDDDVGEVTRYVPPHLRERVHLEEHYDDDKILNRRSGFTFEEYKRIVEMQVKSKFFAAIETVTFNRRISVGISDDNMRDTLIEFYQARWYSLQRRIEEGLRMGKPFKLGSWTLIKHPWGDLITSFPETVWDLMEMMRGLDSKAWTLSPDYVWEKLSKSISELWEDISTEIEKIRAYVEEVHDCLADEQVQVDAHRRVESVLASMAGVSAIQLPVSGFRAPFQLPERRLNVDDGAKIVEVTTSHQTYMASSLEMYDSDDDANAPLGGDSDEELDLRSINFASIAGDGQEMPAYVGRYLTFNEIWNELELGEYSDVQKRLALGLAHDVDMDSEHLDTLVGPIVAYDDKFKTRKMWAFKMGGIRHRLGQFVPIEHVDDM